jgi:hypothetical protein
MKVDGFTKFGIREGGGGGTKGRHQDIRVKRSAIRFKG